MKHSPIYTIGYGKRSIANFLNILLEYKIEFLIDVRSTPYSQFKPEFNRNELESTALQHGIRYVFMGDELGGRPNDTSCYINNKVDYDQVVRRPFFVNGIRRLKTAHKKNIKVALMCSEQKPQDCHRSKLIGKALVKESIGVQHIDENGLLKDQKSVILLSTKGLGEFDLFGEKRLTSNKGYPKDD